MLLVVEMLCLFLEISSSNTDLNILINIEYLIQRVWLIRCYTAGL